MLNLNFQKFLFFNFLFNSFLILVNLFDVFYWYQFDTPYIIVCHSNGITIFNHLFWINFQNNWYLIMPSLCWLPSFVDILLQMNCMPFHLADTAIFFNFFIGFSSSTMIQSIRNNNIIIKFRLNPWDWMSLIAFDFIFWWCRNR